MGRLTLALVLITTATVLSQLQASETTQVELSNPASAIGYLTDNKLAIVDSQGQLFLRDDGRTTGPLASGLGEVHLLISSGSGQIAVAASDGTVRIVGAGEGWTVRTLPGAASQRIVALTFAPSGRLIALGDKGSRYIWSLDGNEPVREEPLNPELHELLAMSADGDYFIAKSAGGQLALWDAAAQRIQVVFDHSQIVPQLAAISPLRDLVAVADSQAPANILLWHMGNGMFVRTINSPGVAKIALFFTPGDTRLVTLDATGKLRAFDPQTGEQVLEDVLAPGNRAVVVADRAAEFAEVRAARDVAVVRPPPSEAHPTYDLAPEDLQDRKNKYVTVPVYFGTNRADRLAVSVWTEFKHFFVTTIGIGAIVLGAVLTTIAGLWRGAKPARIVFGGAILTILVLALLDALDRVHEQTSTPGGRFTSQCDTLHFGRCDVTIPRSHSIGELESPPQFWIFRGEADPESHIILKGVEVLASEKDFIRSLGQTFNKEQRGYDALVFIHGYNVPFEEAARRTAQLTYDLEFPGAAILYSWPSYGEASLYSRDLNNAQESVPSLREFLRILAQKSGAKRIHLIAHSMGTFVLGQAFEIPFVDGDVAQRFHQIVLAAPDIDRKVFLEQIAPPMLKDQRHVTLYASAHDEALAASMQFSGNQRAGSTIPTITLFSGIDTVDASAVDTSFIGHSYFASARSLLTDLQYLLVKDKSIDQRLGLVKLTTPDGDYWAFRP